MADWQLIEEGLKRGYSLDEVTDIIAKEEGVDPSYARERGFDSPAILRRLGYVKPEEVKPEKGFIGNVLDQAAHGVKTAYQGLLSAPGIYAGNPDAERIAGTIQAEQSHEKPKEMREAEAAFADVSKRQSDFESVYGKDSGYMDSIGKIMDMLVTTGKEIVTNPKGMAYEMASQSGNMVAPMVGAYAGGKTGAVTGALLGPKGAVAGGVVGAGAGGFAGSHVMEQSGEFRGKVAERLSELGLEPTAENVSAIFQDKAWLDKTLEETRDKATGTAVTDGVLAAIGGLAVNAPIRAAQKTARAQLGATATAKQVSDAAADILASQPKWQKVAPHLKAGAIGWGGEPISEAAGQQYGYGHVDYGDVGMEAFAAAGEGIGSVYAAAKGMRTKPTLPANVTPPPSITSASSTDDAIKAFKDEVETASPVPRGSFSGMDDLAGLIESERSDLGKRRGLLAQQQQEARDMEAEFSELVKDEQIDQSYWLNDAQKQRDAERAREGGYDLALQQREEQQGRTVEQLAAASEAQGFGNEEPTAMQLAMQQAQQKALDNEFSGLLKQERASLNEMRANVKRVAGVPVEQISTPQLEEIAQSEAHPNTRMAAVAALNDRHDAIQQERERLMQLRENRLANQQSQGGQHGAEPGEDNKQVVTQGVEIRSPDISGGRIDAAVVNAGGEGRGNPTAETVVSSSSSPASALSAEQPTNVRALTENGKPSASWVIRNKETGELLFETFDRKKVDALNTEKYEAVPILEYLQSLNKPRAESPNDAQIVNVRQHTTRRKPASNTIAQAIINLGGISTSLKTDILGDASIKTRPGLFTTNGTGDLGEIAAMLSSGFGFSQIDLNDPTDNSGAKQLADLIARSVNGETILNEEGMILAQQDEEFEQAKAEVNLQAQEIGIKPIRGKRTIDIVQSEINAILAEREEMSRQKKKAQLLLDEVAEQELIEAFDLAMQEYHDETAISRDESRVESARLSAEESAQGDGDSVNQASPVAGRASPTEGGRGEAEVTPEFGLVGQTEEEAIAEEQARHDEDQRKADEDRAEDRRIAAEETARRNVQNVNTVASDNFQLGQSRQEVRRMVHSGAGHENANSGEAKDGNTQDSASTEQGGASNSHGERIHPRSDLPDGTRIVDGNGNPYRVHYQRNSLVVAHPIIDGKPVVSADTSVRFWVDPNREASGENDRLDPIYRDTSTSQEQPAVKQNPAEQPKSDSELQQIGSPQWALDMRNRGEVPEGWYVHGRKGRQDLNTNNVIQMTRDWDVADQYAKKDGSQWLIRPAKDATVLDLSSKSSKDMDRVVERAIRDFENGDLDFIEWIEASIGRDATAGDVENAVRESFAPGDIVNSAGAYDNWEFAGWLVDRFGVDFVETPDGAVAMNGDTGIEKVKVPNEGDQVTKETDAGVAMFNAKSGSVGNPIDTAALESTIASVIAASPSQWSRDTVVTATLFADLPAPILAKAKNEGYDAHGRKSNGEKLTGVAYDGKVYLVQENISSELEAEETLLHERLHQIVHGNAKDPEGKALRQTLGRLYLRMGGKSAIVRMANEAGIDIAGPLAAMDKMATINRPAFITEEFLAHAEGQRAYEKLPEKITRAIREFYGQFRDWLRSSKFVRIAEALGAKLDDFTQADLAWTLKGIRQQEAQTGSKAIRFMTAWHGSPHDHDGFDSSKIGTGEGAQAYGYGLYFSSVREIAEHYRNSLSDGVRGGLGLAGVMPSATDKRLSHGEWIAAKELSELLVSKSNVVQPFSKLDVVSKGRVLSVVNRLIQDFEVRNTVVGFIPIDVVNMLGGKQLSSDDLLHDPSVLINLLPVNANDLVPGSIDSVDVLTAAVALAAAKVHTGLVRFDVSPSDFLAASGAIRHGVSPDILSKIPHPNEFVKGRLYQVELAPAEDELLDWDKTFSEQSDFVKKALGRPNEWLKLVQDHGNRPLNGLGIYKSLEDKFISDKQASEHLRSLGIRGIKYLDGMSRSAGDGNFNYVIFDDADVKITAKESRRASNDLDFTQPQGSEPLRKTSFGYANDTHNLFHVSTFKGNDGDVSTFDVYDTNTGEQLGFVSLGLRDGQITTLVAIEAEQKNVGFGEQLLRSLVARNPDGIYIINMLPEAVPFWQKMGVSLDEHFEGVWEHGNGVLTEEAIQEARDGKRGLAAEDPGGRQKESRGNAESESGRQANNPVSSKGVADKTAPANAGVSVSGESLVRRVASFLFQNKSLDGVEGSSNGSGNLGITQTTGPQGERLISIPANALRAANANSASAESGIQVGGVSADSRSNRVNGGAGVVESDGPVNIIGERPSAVSGSRGSNASRLKGAPNSGPVQATKSISDFLKSSALLAQLKRLVKVPGQRLSLMKSDMVFGGQDLKIVNGIIQSIPVDMMNVLVSGKTSADVAFHNQPMFKLLPNSLIENVAFLDDISGPALADNSSRFGHNNTSHNNTSRIRKLEDVVKRFVAKFQGASQLSIKVVGSRDELPPHVHASKYAEAIYLDDYGQVFLIADNVANEARAFQILLHETIGHFGLSQMMGDKFAGILKAVKQATLAGRKVSETQSNPLQPGDKDYATWDAVKLRYPDATDAELAQEVLARMSETDPGSSIVGYAVATVRQWVRDVARAMGVNVVVSTSELRDLVAKASGYMRRGDNLAEERVPSGLVAASTGVAREGGKRGLESRAATVQPQGPIWSAPEMSRTDNIIYTMQDKNIDLKRVQQAIKEVVGEIRDDIDTYLQEELFHGRAAKITEEFLDKEVNPLISLMRASNVSMEELETFLWARHAKERNAQIAKINEAMPDGGSGLTNKQADDIMAGKDVKIGDKTIAGVKPARKKLLSDLAGRVDAITRGNRALLERYSLESADTLNAWDGAYKHYVPLHREDAESHLAGMGTGQGYSVKGSSSKRATGSSRPVENILANLVLQRERIITRGEKNRVAQSLYGLAKEMPNADLWEVDVKPTMRTTAMIGGREQVVDAIDPAFRSKPNVVFARFNGEDRFVVFNEHNERALRMAEALKNLDADDISHLLGEVSRWTRYFASINTQYNPIFGVTNLVRDVQTGLLNLKSTPIEGKQKELMGNLTHALPAVFKALRADRKGQSASGSWAQLWEEFQEVGGQTGYRDMFRNSHERAEALQNALDPTWWQKTWWGKAATVGGILAAPEQVFVEKVGKPLMELLSDYNTMMENGIRLSAYKLALDSGMTKERAASLAKNLTVNFNRKGQAARQVGAMYAFFNASIQGTARMAETLNHGAKPGELLGKAGKQIVYGGLLLGAVQAMLLMAAGFDDEEPPEFVRDRNIIIPTGNGKYVSIPMPLGFHVLPAISRISIEFTAGGFKKPGEHLVHIMDVLLDSFNPIGNAGLSMQTVAPTVLDPIAALTENKDWSGRQIARQDFSKLNPTPGYTRAKDTASSLSRGLAYAFNYLSGGGEYGIGIVSPTPDQIDYLLGQLTGGVGRELGKVLTTGETMATGEDLPPHKIPLVGRFYGDTTGQSSEASKFYGTLEKLSEHRGTLDRMKDAHDVEAYREYAKEHPESRLYARAARVQRELASLRKLKRKMIERNADRAKVRQIEDRMRTLMTRFNQSVSEQKGDH